ncbi:MFS transporter [Streptomyces sp. 1114.5]|uniref:MFS transporter n=1 Tax=Streptomyces sp. 1114.5 TaxID=1938830 RepID=UPI000EB16D65|nr:MFS transporter [Streptomyces sp. 1114.5]RKT11403.1 MFS transporter [Streptomyces sp. 1114.5]
MSAVVTTAVRRALSGFSMLPDRGPGRTLFWATVVNTVGTGMYLTSSALFFVRVVGMSQTQVGLGLTVSGLIGLLAGVPVGRLADRSGPRRVYLVMLGAEALAMAALVLARSFTTFVLLCSCISLAATASAAARGPLVRAVGGERPTHLRSCLRSGSNLGVALGGPLAALAIGSGTRTGYELLILGNAVTFAVCAAMVSRLPHVPPVPPGGADGQRRAGVSRPYLCLVGLNAVMMQQFPVLPLVLPLWIFLHTRAPHAIVGVIVPLSTVLVVLLQVRMSRGIDSPAAAARFMARSGFAVLAGFALMGAMAALPGWLASAVLVLAMVVYTFGEIWYSAASFELSFALAPAESQGRYQGVFSMGSGIGRVVSQSLATLLCLGLGFAGWILLGVLILAAGLAAVPTTRWALRTGPGDEPAPPPGAQQVPAGAR